MIVKQETQCTHTLYVSTVYETAAWTSSATQHTVLSLSNSYKQCTLTELLLTGGELVVISASRLSRLTARSTMPPFAQAHSAAHSALGVGSIYKTVYKYVKHVQDRHNKAMRKQRAHAAS